ncbi:MAG: hypothetical protein GY820_24455 [Gammaproteobacteria bacterium]|nr:hypothetical protein [Gammaproteobacteria bacterium]
MQASFIPLHFEKAMQANNASKQVMQAIHASNAISASKQTTFSMWACTATKKQSSFMREKSDFYFAIFKVF